MARITVMMFSAPLAAGACTGSLPSAAPTRSERVTASSSAAQSRCHFPNGQPPVPLTTITDGAPPAYAHALPSGLEAERERLLTCVQDGERVAVELNPQNHSKVTTLCAVSDAASIACVRGVLEATRVASPVRLMVAGPKKGPDVSNAINQKVARDYFHEFKSCYDGARVNSPGVEGTVAITFLVGSSGAVEATEIQGNSTGSHELACCVQERVIRWRFDDGTCSALTYRIPFRMR